MGNFLDQSRMISGLTDLYRQIKDINPILATQHKCVFDGIFQLSHIAGPLIVHDNAHGILSDILDFHSRLLVITMNKVIGQ